MQVDCKRSGKRNMNCVEDGATDGSVNVVDDGGDTSTGVLPSASLTTTI